MPMHDSLPDEQIAAYEAAIAELASSTPAGSDAKVVKRLRHQFGSDAFYELIAIARLQRKARQKLGEGVWWATDRALQQATAWQVAKLKSSWFGDHLVYDLCCGIGGDALELARRGAPNGGVVAVDMDPVIQQYTEANLRKAVSGDSATTGTIKTVCEDVLKIEIPANAAIHLDPDRRADGKRTTRPEDYQPSLSQILPRIEAAPAAIIKLAPAAKIELAKIELDDRTHRAWISLSGGVREQSLIFGDALPRGEFQPRSVSAFAIHSDGSYSRFDASDTPAGELDSIRVASAKSPGQWIIDPDAAVRAAGMTEYFARTYGLKTLGGPTGFLTSEDEIDDARMEKIREIASVGEVIWSGSCDERKLRRELRQRNQYAERIKVRGSGHDPAVLSKRLRPCGESPIGLWIGRAEKGVFAAFTR